MTEAQYKKWLANQPTEVKNYMLNLIVGEVVVTQTENKTCGAYLDVSFIAKVLSIPDEFEPDGESLTFADAKTGEAIDPFYKGKLVKAP